MSIITVLLAIFFTFASSIKILGWQKFIFETQLTFFKKYGLSRGHMFLVGIIELTAALLLAGSLVFSHEILNGLGALGIVFISAGAILFHQKFDTFEDAIPAIVTLSLSAVLVVSNQSILEHFI